MGSNQEAYDAECAALSHALEKDGIGRARPRTEIRHPGSKAHRGTAAGEARHQHRDPVVSGAQRNPWQREGGRVGQGSGRAARPPRAVPAIPGQPQAGNLGEEVGGG